MNLFLRGVVLGFSIAAPVGPIGVLCIRRTLAQGRVVGLASGLGAASADAVYGCIAGFGLTAISGFLIAQQQWLGILGGLFLCVLGIRTLRARPAGPGEEPRGVTVAAAYGSVFVLTLTNPMTILSFAAMFAGLGIASNGRDFAAAAALVGGVFVGSALWWLTLSGGVAVLRHRFDARAMHWVNWISGSVILIFGLWALTRGLSFAPLARTAH